MIDGMKELRFQVKATGYYPTADGHSTAENRLEGGPVDRKGNPLCTLQAFLNGRAPFVSVAMDYKNGLPYGTPLFIPALNAKYGKTIPFLVVDTGGAFVGKGLARMDICTADRKASVNPWVNREVDVVALVKE